MTTSSLAEHFWVGKKSALLTDAILVATGVLAMVVAAKVKVHVWPSPVPVTLGTLAVLMIGTAYGTRLGLITIGSYLALGAAGLAVFAGPAAGLSYMMGGTGGYLLGYALAVGLLGYAARNGLDRNALKFAPVLVGANLLIYIPGLLWLRGFADSWSQTFAWGVTPFLMGDALKMALAALLLPAVWRAVHKLAPGR